jgi:hypothetical protein
MEHAPRGIRSVCPLFVLYWPCAGLSSIGRATQDFAATPGSMQYDEKLRRQQPLMRSLLGLIFGIVLVPLVVLAYLTYGNVPVAVSDPPFPHEAQLVHMPLNARIQKEMVGTHMEPDQLPSLPAPASTLSAAPSVTAFTTNPLPSATTCIPMRRNCSRHTGTIRAL